MKVASSQPWDLIEILLSARVICCRFTLCFEIENRFISVAHRTVCCLRATASIFCPHNQMPYTQTHLNSHLFTSSPTLSKHTSYRLKRIYGYIMLRFFFVRARETMK